MDVSETPLTVSSSVAVVFVAPNLWANTEPEAEASVSKPPLISVVFVNCGVQLSHSTSCILELNIAYWIYTGHLKKYPVFLS